MIAILIGPMKMEMMMAVNHLPNLPAVTTTTTLKNKRFLQAKQNNRQPALTLLEITLISGTILMKNTADITLAQSVIL